MPVVGSPRTFHDKFKFLIEIEEFQSAGFQKCSELSVEAAVIEYKEGGTLVANKSPGTLTYPPVTIERGASFDDDAYDWFQSVADAASLSSDTPGAGQGVGALEPAYKRDVDIVQQDRNGAELKRWRLFEAWPSKFTAGEWDNEADEKTIEMLELTFEFFLKV